MGSTTSPQDSHSCPNCGVSGNQAVASDHHESSLCDCHNENCAVDRYWAEQYDGEAA
jgi:hypothetical protein